MADAIPYTNAEKRAIVAEQHPEFGKLNLGYIKAGIADILKLIGRDGIFDEYTLHDMTHINGMLELLNTIVPPTTAEIMTPADWLLIVLSCYFHDLGMLVTRDEFANRDSSEFPEFRENKLLIGDDGVDYADSLSHLPSDERERFYYQEFVRSHHAERIQHWIMGRVGTALGITHGAVAAVEILLSGLEDKLREDLALVCRSHHEDNLDEIKHI